MYRELKWDDDHVWVLAGMSVKNITYTVALFSALDVSVRKKNMHDFLCILRETEWPLVLQTSTAITVHQLILFSLT